MVDFVLAPERTALVNVDMQNCFVHGSPFSAPDGMAVLGRINRVAAACRDAGILVIHTSHVLRPDGSNIGVLGEIAAIVKRGTINKGSESAALHKGLVVDSRDILLEKPRFGAFHGTDLELIQVLTGSTALSSLGLQQMSVVKQPPARPRFAIFACFSLATVLQPSISEISRVPTCRRRRAPPSNSCLLKYSRPTR